MRDRVIGRVARAVPLAVQQRFKMAGAYRLLHVFYDKYGAELLFQSEWAEEFKQNSTKVLEYWKEYRYPKELTIQRGSGEKIAFRDEDFDTV